MQDDPALSWLAAVEPAWSGHHAALAARIAQPRAVRLTEEQEALALGLAQRLVLSLAEQLPLASEAPEIWLKWERDGIPASAMLAPALLARVEEHRWRRYQPLPPVVPAAPLFDAAAQNPEARLPDTVPAETGNAIDAAYLGLRIADSARSNAIGQPLLLPSELDPSLLRALLLDIAAQDLALVGDSDSRRAADMAHAIDRLMHSPSGDSIDSASASYYKALREADTLADAACAGLIRGDWLALVALLAVAVRGGFARTAAALLGANDDQIIAALAHLGVGPADAGMLIDALSDVPGRPETATGAIEPHGTRDAVAARAAQFRDDRP